MHACIHLDVLTLLVDDIKLSVERIASVTALHVATYALQVKCAYSNRTSASHSLGLLVNCISRHVPLCWLKRSPVNVDVMRVNLKQLHGNGVEPCSREHQVN